MRKVKIPKKKFLLISLILILFIFTIGFSYLNTSLSLNGNLTVKGGLYDVTFDSRGGTLVNPIRILFNGTKGDFPETTKQGYSFSGWYSDPIDGDEYKSYDDVEDNITLYAHWDANEYKIYFAGNGGTNLPEPLTRRFGESFNFPTQIPTRTGYVFQGWLYSSTGNTSATATSNETSIIGKGYAAGALVSNCTACILNTDSDTTYVAIWDATSPQITKISSSSTSYTTNSITFTPTVTDEVGGLQYKWDDGDYTTTNTLTTSTTGNHTLTVKNNAGKTATQTVTVNSKTQYGYKEATTWSTTWTETHGEFYKSKKEYNVSYDKTVRETISCNYQSDGDTVNLSTAITNCKTLPSTSRITVHSGTITATTESPGGYDSAQPSLDYCTIDGFQFGTSSRWLGWYIKDNNGNAIIRKTQGSLDDGDYSNRSGFTYKSQTGTFNSITSLTNVPTCSDGQVYVRKWYFTSLDYTSVTNYQTGWQDKDTTTLGTVTKVDERYIYAAPTAWSAINWEDTKREKTPSLDNSYTRTVYKSDGFNM